MVTRAFRQWTVRPWIRLWATRKENEKYLVIDVRGAEEYNAGHVKFAINIPVEDLEGRLGEIEKYKNENVVTICNTGKKSAKAAELLSSKGFTKVFNAVGVKEYTYTNFYQDVQTYLMPVQFFQNIRKRLYFPKFLNLKKYPYLIRCSLELLF